MKLKIINRIISGLIILTNIYFIPLSFNIIKSTGGPFGYGLLLLPFILPANLLLITAGLTFKQKYQNNILLLRINAVGLMWNLFWLWMFLITLK